MEEEDDGAAPVVLLFGCWACSCSSCSVDVDTANDDDDDADEETGLRSIGDIDEEEENTTPKASTTPEKDESSLFSGKDNSDITVSIIDNKGSIRVGGRRIIIIHSCLWFWRVVVCPLLLLLLLLCLLLLLVIVAFVWLFFFGYIFYWHQHQSTHNGNYCSTCC